MPSDLTQAYPVERVGGHMVIPPSLSSSSPAASPPTWNRTSPGASEMRQTPDSRAAKNHPGNLCLPRDFPRTTTVLLLRRSGEPNVVTNDRCRPDGQRLRIGDVELLELGSCPYILPQKVLKNLDRKLLARAATISKAERREAGMVADRKRLTIDDAVDGPKTAINQSINIPTLFS
jgi:hypothetical protein